MKEVEDGGDLYCYAKIKARSLQSADQLSRMQVTSYGNSGQRRMVSRNANIVNTASTNIISRLRLEWLKQQLIYEDVHLLECTDHEELVKILRASMMAKETLSV